jgi:TetR/AcrR family transcriptional regulator, cholesterol catabolism regulator
VGSAESGQNGAGATQRQLTKMQERVAGSELPAGPADRVLTDLRRRQIVEGASAVLFEHGYHGASIRDIAQACGMSMGQLYHYISSKDDILYLMHVYSQEMWHQYLAEGGFDDIADPVARLEHGLRITIKYLSENRELYQFLYTESKYLDREHLHDVLELDDQNVVGFYRHLLGEIPGYAAGDHVDLAANLVAFICVFLSLRGWNLHLSGEEDVDEAVDYLVGFVFRGLGTGQPHRSEEDAC